MNTPTSISLEDRIRQALPGRRFSSAQLSELAQVMEVIAAAMADGAIMAARKGPDYDD